MLTRDGTARTVYSTGGVPYNVFSYVLGAAPVNPPPTGGTDAEFATNAKAQPETFSQTAFSDPDLVTEATAFKDINPRSAVRYVAVRNGSWGSASTWYDTVAGANAVPSTQGAAALIPQGVTVDYDSAAGTVADLGNVRVDGQLITDTTADRTFPMELTYVDWTGYLEVGTEASPVPANVNIEFAPWNSNTDMDFANDPMKLGRGIACFDGAVSIYGAAKTEWIRVTGGYNAGVNQITLSGPITGWEIGDHVMLTGTKMRGKALGTWEDWENEHFTIDAIDQTTPSAPVITLSGNLVYSHLPDWQEAANTAHMANLTRNIEFKIPDGQTSEIWQRPHTMFKGEGTIDVSYASFKDYGRTDHDYARMTDPEGPYSGLETDGGDAWDGPTFMALHGMGAVTAKTNFTGRYPLHFHRCGIVNPLTPAVHSKGCVVDGSTAWGIVHHDSHALIEWAVAIRHRSAGIAAEGGGSFGVWDHCFTSESLISRKSFTEAQTKTGGNETGDLGCGMWINSRLPHVQNCVSCNNNCNYLWTSRVNSAQNTDPYPGAVETPELFYGLADIPGVPVSKSFSVIEGFLNNESYACVFAMSVAKKAPLQHHNGRSFLQGFNAWECYVGAAFQYTGHYTMADFTIHGFNPANRSQAPYQGLRAISIFRQSVDMVVVRGDIKEFKDGSKISLDGGNGFFSNLGNSFVDMSHTNVDVPYNCGNQDIDLEALGTWDNLSDGLIDARYLTAAQVGPVAPITATYDEDESVWLGNDEYMLIGTYTDRLGTQSRILAMDINNTLTTLQSQKPANRSTKNEGALILLSRQQMEAQLQTYGVYETPAGEIVLVLSELIQDRFDGAFTTIRTPVAVRSSQSYFNGVGVTNHGSIIGQFGGAFDSFAPAGTPGLT